MAPTNQERVNVSINLLTSGLTPFVERELQAVFKDNWTDNAPHAQWRDGAMQWDAASLLRTMWDTWNDVFRHKLGHDERSLVSQLRTCRNNCMHQKPFSHDDAYRCMDNVERLLAAISAPESDRAARQKQELLRAQFEERTRRAKERQTELLALLRPELTAQLSDASSDLVLLITGYLHEKDGFQDIEPQTLSLWFNEILSSVQNDRSAQTVRIPATHINRDSFPQLSSETSLNLKAIQDIPVDGKNVKPIALYLPNDTHVPIHTWVDFAAESVRWLLQQSRPLPIPFESSNRSRWFLNDTPEHKRIDQRKKFKTISANGKIIYMDADRSAQMFLNDIYALCLELQVKPEEFRVTMR